MNERILFTDDELQMISLAIQNTFMDGEDAGFTKKQIKASESAIEKIKHLRLNKKKSPRN